MTAGAQAGGVLQAPCSVKTDRPNARAPGKSPGFARTPGPTRIAFRWSRTRRSVNAATIHPELFGAPEEKGMEWARHPEMMMKRIKEQRGKAAEQRKAAVPLISLFSRASLRTPDNPWGTPFPL